MKKIRIFLFTLFLTLFFCPVVLAEGFVIDAYRIEMNVQDDNSYRITETIDTRFTEQLHGIYRTIPSFSNQGYPISLLDIKILSGHPFTVIQDDRNQTIQIGDAAAWAKPKESYILSYRYLLGDDHNKDADELYFNLIGSGWATTISNVSFTIRMPHDFDASKLSFKYAGDTNDNGSRIRYTIADNLISGTLQGSLAPHQPLTVLLTLPEGYYGSIPRQTDYAALIARSAFLIYPILTLLGVLVWLRWGRNRPLIPTVEFYPPEGLNSADVGYLYDHSVDNQDILSLILCWAADKKLKIEEQLTETEFGTKKEFTFTRLADLADTAKPYEQTVFFDLFHRFGNGEQVTDQQLSNDFHKTVTAAKQQVQNTFQAKKETAVYDKKGRLCQTILIALAALCMFFVCFLFSSSFTDEGNLAIFLAAFFITLFAVLFCAVTAQLTVSFFQRRNRKILIPLAVLYPALLAAGGLVLTAQSAKMLLPQSLGLLSVAVLTGLSAYSDKRTALGDAYLAKILGFRNFLVSAEKERIEALAEENPAYFYDVLPYAMVLGVTNQWAKQFEHISLQPPNWYQSEYNTVSFNSLAFVGSLSAGMMQTIGSMSSAPGAFGGFGGSGGGGGGGW
ncbi:MAG: DUF2207 domain-containing protein [Negativicutes bacterium]|nr:DUF2207 domain-containing protein [Negativicutes bacterium]